MERCDPACLSIGQLSVQLKLARCPAAALCRRRALGYSKEKSHRDTHQIRSPVRPEEMIVSYQVVYVDAWSLVTPNSSRMTGLFAAFPAVWWSMIHCEPHPTGSDVSPQLPCGFYQFTLRR